MLGVGQAAFALSVVTANVNAAGTLRRFLPKLDIAINVVLVQEVRTLLGGLDDLSSWCKKRGWKSLWLPAINTGPGVSSGVGILVRDYMGLTCCPAGEGGSEVYGSRVLAAKVQFPGALAITAYSAYFVDGTGMADQNVLIASALGKHIGKQPRQVIVGGDFNMSPAEMSDSDVPAMAGLQIVATSKPTCVQAKSSSVLDFFLVSSALAKAVKSLDRLEFTGLTPHLPVALGFHSSLASIRYLTLAAPPLIPKVPPFGPRNRPQDWSALEALLGKAEAAVAAATQSELHDALTEVYRAFANTAEKELCSATDTVLKVYGRRGEAPRQVWRSVIPPARIPEGLAGAFKLAEQRSDAWKWLHTQSMLVRQEADLCAADLGRGRQVLLDLAQSISHDRLQHLGLGPDQELQEAVLSLRDLAERAAQLPTSEDPDMSWDNDLGYFVEQLIGKAAEALKGSSRASSAWWSEWSASALQAGAKRAHAVARAPLAWRPTEVLASGVQSGDPMHLLAAEGDLFAKHWQAQRSRQSLGLPDLVLTGQPGPPVPVHVIRAVSRSYSIATAQVQDGFHVAHFAMLSDGALACLARIFALMEITGLVPRQVENIILAMIGKPRGGYRPIALFAAFCRIWARCRAHYVKAWQISFDRPFFACAKGRAPYDTVWRQAIRAERAVLTGGAAATILWDGHKFFEKFSLKRLFEQGRMFGFPDFVLRVAINLYLGPRHMVMSGLTLAAWFVKHGLPAGCTHADAFVKLYCLAQFDQFCLANPGVVLEVYIDDFAISAARQGSGAVSEVVEVLCSAASDLRRRIEGPMLGQLDKEKGNIVASTTLIARRLAAALGGGFGRAVGSAANLGIDFASGGRRALHCRSGKRKGRLSTASIRARRAAKFKKAGGMANSRKLYLCGVRPAALYDAPVNGISDSEALRTRRLLLPALAPFSGRPSATAKVCLHGDPVALALIAPVVQWACEVWRALNAGTGPHFSLGFLSRLWHDSAGLHGTSWQACRGPLNAAVLSLARIAWAMTGPFELRDDLGRRHVLTWHSPKMLEVILLQGVQRYHERRLAKQLWGSYSERRACSEHIGKLIRSKQLDARGRAIVAAVACDALWTPVRAKQAGYLVDTCCQKCGLADDDLWHRIVDCPAVAAERLRAIGASELEALRRTPLADKARSLRGFILHPADVMARPAAQACCTFNGELMPGEIHRFLCGETFPDGSCTAAPLAELRRASWAVAWPRPCQPGTFDIIAGPVWDTLPQTPQAAEYVAYAVAAQAALLSSKVHLVPDCLGVIQAHNSTVPLLQRHRQQYAGLVRIAKVDAAGAFLCQASHIKAHQSAEDVADTCIRRWIAGNSVADCSAKSAVACHPPLGDVVVKASAEVLAANSVLKLTSDLWRLWPCDHTKHPRTGREQPSASPAARARRRRQQDLDTHDWGFSFGVWRCKHCFLVTSDPTGVQQVGPRGLGKCAGLPKHFRPLLRDPQGHSLIAILQTNEVPFLFCTRCACVAMRRVCHLGKPCAGLNSGGKTRLTRLRSGLHPDCQSKHGVVASAVLLHVLGLPAAVLLGSELVWKLTA